MGLAMRSLWQAAYRMSLMVWLAEVLGSLLERLLVGFLTGRLDRVSRD